MLSYKMKKTMREVKRKVGKVLKLDQAFDKSIRNDLSKGKYDVQ